MSFLTLINNVQKRAGVEVISNPTANTSPTSKQFVALAQVEGKELALRHPWTALQKRETQAALAAEDQGTLVSIAADISLQSIGMMTLWNETTDQQIIGPVSRQDWAALKGHGVTNPYPHFRVYGGKLYITPAPAVSDSLVFEYISVNWCQSSGGTGQAAWAADTDTGVLDEHTMELGLYWRFLAAQGLDYAEAFASYEARVALLMNMDGSKPVLSMNRWPRQSGMIVANTVTRSF